MASAIDALKRAQVRITGHGWCKAGTSQNPAAFSGSPHDAAAFRGFSLKEAVLGRHTQAGDPHEEEALKRLKDYLDVEDLDNWNDADERTLEDVQCALMGAMNAFFLNPKDNSMPDDKPNAPADRPGHAESIEGVLDTFQGELDRLTRRAGRIQAQTSKAFAGAHGAFEHAEYINGVVEEATGRLTRFLGPPPNTIAMPRQRAIEDAVVVSEGKPGNAGP